MIVLSILLVLAVIAYIVLFVNRQNEEEQQETEKTVSIYPQDFDAKNITAFSFTTDKSQVLDFENKDNTWTYKKDSKFPVNQSNVSTMVSTLSSLVGKREVESNLDKMSDYGLDKPSRVITLTNSSNQKVTLYFGNVNNITGDYYLYTDKEHKIYSTESANYTAFDSHLMDLIAIDSAPSIDSSLIKTITMKKSDGTWIATFKESGDSKLDYTGELTWFLTNPSKVQSGMDSQAADELISHFTDFTVESCVAYGVTKAQLKNYGLDHPRMTIQVAYDTTKKFDIFIGSKTPEGSYYVKWKGSNQVCVLNKDTVDYLLGINNSTFIVTNPLNIASSAVNKLVINVDKNSKTFTSKDSNFEELISQIQAINSEKFYSQGGGEYSEISGNVVTLTYVLKDHKNFNTVICKLVPYDKDYYALSVNDKTQWLINKLDVTKLIEIVK
ncbi:hypothetical protein P261_02143 [Lachnospiraceae bacterium TWA4]|nr:hypothetical protein P261_02143 [Lachnospiraceae bacterium TWA4]